MDSEPHALPTGTWRFCALSAAAALYGAIWLGAAASEPGRGLVIGPAGGRTVESSKSKQPSPDDRVEKVPGGWRLGGRPEIYPSNPLVPADKADPFPSPQNKTNDTPPSRKH